jgi:NAD-dependent dihydropyrimidine dehydrogenase PreA subunit
VSEVKFNVFSGGTVTIDHSLCAKCETKVCVEVCQTVGNGNILELNADGLPQLKVEEQLVARGSCVEDMGCMLACQIHGQKAIVFDLPMPELDLAIQEMAEKPVYKRALQET